MNKPEKRDTEEYECDEICERGECIGYNQAIEDYEAYIKSKDHAEELRGRYEIDEEKVFHNIDCWFGTEVNEDYIKYLIKKLAKSNDIVRVK